MNSLRQLLAGVIRIDPSGFDLAFTVRCGIGFAAAILIAARSGQPLFAVAAAMGAMSTGFGSQQGVYRTRAATMIAMALAMALSTFAGSISSHSVPVELALLALWGAIYGLSAALGAAASAVALNATVALVMFGNFPLPFATALEASAFVLFGGFVQTLLLIASWPIGRYRQERQAFAFALRSLAEYAREIDCSHPLVPPASGLTAIESALADPRPFGRRAVFSAFQTLLDEIGRTRATLGRIASSNCTAYLPQRTLVASTLDRIADALQHGTATADEALLAQLQRPSGDPLVTALFGQLRALVRNAAIPLDGWSLHGPAVPRLGRSAFTEALTTVRANLRLDTPFGRHALRCAIVLAAIGGLAHVLPLQRGYWMTLTAVLVLRPDFTTTFVRGIARIAGTLLGVVLATVVVLVIPASSQAALALAILFAVGGYAVFLMNYALYTVTITAYVVFVLSLIGLPEHAAVTSRAIATLAGGTLALLSYAVWPTWESPQTRASIRALLAADSAYGGALLGAMAAGAIDGRSLRPMRDAVWAARASAEASLERMLSEPPGRDDIPRGAALGIMAASQRIGLANLTLGALPPSPETQSPQLAAFAVELSAAFDAIRRLLDNEDAPNCNEALRNAYGRIAGDAELTSALDMIVDAVNTIADIARGMRAAPT